MCCLLITNGLAQSIPWVVKRTVEAIATSGSSWTIGKLTLLIVGLAIAQALIRIPSRILIFNAAREAEYELRGHLFSRLCEATHAFYREFRTGDLMSRLTSDLASVRALFGPGVLHVVNTLFAYAVALPLMIRIDPWLTLWSLLPYPALLIGARYFARGIYDRSNQMQVALAGMTSAVQEDLAGIRELKLYTVEPLRSNLFADSAGEYLRQAMRLARWRAGLVPFIGVGTGASLVIVLWVGGLGVIHDQLTLGDLVAFNLYAGILAWPTMAIGWILSLWQRGIASWHRLLEIRDAAVAMEAPRAEAEVEVEQPTTTLSIEVRGLDVEIDGKRILDSVSFAIPDGALCAVVGKVGSGKTILVEAIARLVTIPEGTVFIGGRDATKIDLAWVRSKIAYAPQSAFLFSTTIRDNILYSLPDSGIPPDELDRRIEEAVSVAGLVPDLARFPEGLETIVGERGLSLSGGQRQRVALARALVADRSILLLDDTLSAVDAATERQILTRLTDADGAKRRTVILVSHRLSALQHADRIVVLDQGRVAETGTHAELLDGEGVYSDLYHRQILLQELETGDE